MKPIKDFPASAAARIKYILTDIDDTLTEEGKLGPEAYSALWELHNKGFKVIPVTGRPAGWCDMIMRQWPVEAVIGENGAFVYYHDDKAIKTFTHPSVAEEETVKKLEEVYKAVKTKIPLVRKSRDQFCRIYDLAIDFNEDPPYLGYETAQEIKEICVGMNAEAKVSSIHVNTWFGNYSKKDMAELFLQQVQGLSLEEIQEQTIFCGDSPNDEPMFEYLEHSFAVANILDFASVLEHKPAYVASQKGGKGFVEIAKTLQ